MYSNALRQNPLFKPKKTFKEGVDDFSIGTTTKPCHWDTVPKQANRTKFAKSSKGVFANCQSTIENHNTPRVYELDATLQQKQFESINRNREKPSKHNEGD